MYMYMYYVASVSIKGLMLTDLRVGRSKTWQNASEANCIHHIVQDQSSRKISAFLNFHSFITVYMYKTLIHEQTYKN